MSLQAITWAFDQHDTTPTQRLVLLCLADYANQDDQAWPKPATIAKRTGLGVASVYRATSQLVESGHLERDDKVLTLRIGFSQGEKDSHSEKPYIEEPKENPKEPTGGEGEITDIFKVGNHFAATFNPRRKDLDAGQRKIIYDALKVGTADELCRCIDAAYASDWHQKRGEWENRPGKKHNTLSAILKPKQRSQMGDGYTQRERIDFWLDREPAPAGPSQEEIDKWNLANARFANGTGPDPGPSPWNKERE